MRLKTIKGVYVKNKRVLVRADLNVPLAEGKIKDDFRIYRIIPTIRYLISKEAKIIIIGHLGRPAKDGKNKEDLSMRAIARRLEKVLGHKVGFVSESVGEKAQNAALHMKPCDVLLLENLRFYKKEEQNDEVFASKLATLADVYVNEAFSASHRTHASLCVITRFLPSYAGPLFAQEVNTLHKIYHKPKKPLVIAIGGAKIGTKVKLIQRFFNRANHVLIGGAIANYVLKAKGIAIGKSKVDKQSKDDLHDLNWMSPKIHLPVDVVVAREISPSAWTKTKGVGKVKSNEMILDIGPDTMELFNKIVASAKTIVWNGPMGFCELPAFAAGTKSFARAVAESKAFSMVGGGDSITFINALGLSHNIDFISTGGGAMLEFLGGAPMPGLEALLRKKKK